MQLRQADLLSEYKSDSMKICARKRNVPVVSCRPVWRSSTGCALRIQCGVIRHVLYRRTWHVHWCRSASTDWHTAVRKCLRRESDRRSRGDRFKTDATSAHCSVAAAADSSTRSWLLSALNRSVQQLLHFAIAIARCLLCFRQLMYHCTAASINLHMASRFHFDTQF